LLLKYWLNSKKTRVVSLQELDEQIQARIDEKARINFIPALNFLFLLGCLDYDSNTDALYYQKESGVNQ